MKRLKFMGCSAVLALAMMALVGVSSAAATEDFLSEREFTSLQATNVGGAHVFTGTIFGSKFVLSCENVTFTGFLIGLQTSTWRGTPAFSNCLTGSEGGEKTTVTTSGCRVLFNANGEMSLVNGIEEVCEGITWNMGSCIVNIPAQAGLKNIGYSYVGTESKREIVAKAALTNIKYKFVKTPLCSVTWEFGNGTYQGEWKIAGKDTSTGSRVGVWVK